MADTYSCFSVRASYKLKSQAPDETFPSMTTIREIIELCIPIDGPVIHYGGGGLQNGRGGGRGSDVLPLKKF